MRSCSEPEPRVPDKNLMKWREVKKSLLFSLFSYWRKPEYNIKLKQAKKFRKFFDIFKLWSFSIVIIFGIGILMTILIERSGYDLAKHSVVDLFLNQPVYIIIFLVFIWAPIAEELTFRLGLKYSPYRVGISAALIISALAGAGLVIFSDYFKFFNDWIRVFSDLEALLAYILVVAIIGFGIGQLLKKKVSQRRAEKFYQAKFRFIFYFSAVLFGGIHLFNFLNLGDIWYLAIILVFPQLFLGLVLGYIRMVYGISWSIVFHFIHNAVISLPIILAGLVSPETWEAAASGDTEKFNSIAPPEMLIIFFTIGFILFILMAVLASFVMILMEYFRFIRR